ncbi:BnaCnng09270D [Brassica napus]|uniref:BnaCnng09270D protein n=1 Tax=Brassica napus TaxID=3708 RepID=A0A078HS39_BRANA|nr:BnaCnng09270D [Brassica napus]
MEVEADLETSGSLKLLLGHHRHSLNQMLEAATTEGYDIYYTSIGGTTIPPFPGSVGSGDQNMSYTHIFDQVKEERRDARSNGGSVGNTPSRPINDQWSHESTAPGSFKFCCFSWGRKGSSY